MATKIPIGDAREISRQRRCPMVVVFGIDAQCDTFVVTTYGATKALCKVAASFGAQFAEAVLKGTVSPPEFEPEGGIDQPAMFAGKRE